MKYRVLTDINSGQHRPGDIIELSPQEAKAMPWALEPYREPAPAAKEEKKQDEKKG